jgi:hypothetical protein
VHGTFIPHPNSHSYVQKCSSLALNKLCQCASTAIAVDHRACSAACTAYALPFCLHQALIALRLAVQAMEDKLQRLRQSIGRKAAQVAAPAEQAAQQAKRSLFPMQLVLAAEDAVVRFEHHPLEVSRVGCHWLGAKQSHLPYALAIHMYHTATHGLLLQTPLPAFRCSPQGWLGVHGPLLQKLAVQRQLWTDIATTVNPADTDAPLHAAMVQTAFATAAEAGHRAWEGVMGDLSQMYRMLVQQVGGRTASNPPLHIGAARRRCPGASVPLWSGPGVLRAEYPGVGGPWPVGVPSHEF